MSDYAITRTAILPANAQFSYRAAHLNLVRITPPAVGVLTVAEGANPGAVRKRSRYALFELTRTGMGRRFRLTKPPRDGGEAYYVLMSLGGVAGDVCDCTGFSQHGRCKHVESVRRLVISGSFPDPPTDQDFLELQSFLSPPPPRKRAKGGAGRRRR